MNSKQFLKEGFIEDAHEAHMDHEVQMARVDCYYAAEHAIVLHKLLRNISEEQGLEGWVASKITLANDYLKSVREHLEYQMMNTDADEEDFLPLAEGLTSVKKKLSEAADSKDIQEFERGPWYIIVKGEVVPEDDGSPRKFNWLNAAKVFFRKMLDDDPTTAAQLKSEYDNATDKKSVVYYSKKLPSASSDNSSLEESEKRPGLWANIRAKRERIKAGSDERMRKPGSKGAPTNKDLKSIRASSESMHEDGLNLDKKKSDFKNSLNLNLGSVRGLPINAGIQTAQTPQSYSNRPGASSMGLQPSLSIGNPESGPFAQISKQGGMVGYKKTFEGLGPEQKRVGQLGPTEKVKKNSGARGKLVGANESVEQGVVEGSTNKTLFVIYYKTGKGFDAGTGDVGILASNEQKAKEKFAKKYPHFIVTKIVEGMKYVLVDYRGNYYKGMDKFGRNLSTRNPEEAEIFNLERDAKDIALWTRNRFKAIPWSGQQGVAEGSTSKEKQKTPYRDINSPEYKAAAEKQKKKMANDQAAEPGKKLLDKIKKKGVAEGKWSHNAITGQKLDPRTGEILPVKEKPLTMKQMFAPKAQPKLTLDDVWRKVENVVSQIYPDGDPNDYMAPWLEKHGIRDFKIGEILDRAAKKNGYKDMYDYWNSMGEQGVTEGLPGSLSASDYMPGATLPHTNWNCIKCSGHKFMYSLDGKLTKDNKKGAIRVKCPDCGGSGLKKPDPGHDYFGRKKEEGVAEGSTNDYFKRRKDEEDRIAGTKAPAKRTPQQTDYAKRRAQEKKVEQGVAEGSESKISKCASLAAKYFNSAGLQHQYDIDEYIKNNAGNDPIVNKCASLAAKYFNSEGLQRQYDIDEYIKVNAKQGVAEGVAETLPLDDAIKVLKHYGANSFIKSIDNLKFYKNDRPLSIDLIWNDDGTRSVRLSQLNSATRQLKGQGVSEESAKALVSKWMELHRRYGGYDDFDFNEMKKRVIFDPDYKSELEKEIKFAQQRNQGVAEGLAPGQAAWKKEMMEKGAVRFKRDQHGGGAVDRIVAYDKDGKVVGGFNRKGVAEGSSDKVHLKTPKHGLADHPGRNTGVGLSTFAATSEQDRCPKCNSLYKNHYQKQGVAASKNKSDKKS